MLFAFDLDRTVVTQSYDLPSEVITTLKRLKGEGHEVCVITGRSKVGVSPYPEIIALCDYVGLNHGGVILDTTNNSEKVIFQSDTPQDLVLHAIENYQTDDSHVVFNIGGFWYAHDITKKRWQGYEKMGYILKSHKDFKNDIAAGTAKAIDKFGVFKEDCTTILTEVKANYPDLCYYHWDGFGFEALGADSTKGKALETIANLYNIPQSDTIAFGDGVNDIEMIEWAGKGIGVGPDTHPDVLAAASEVVISAEELGVVKWLEANILN